MADDLEFDAGTAFGEPGVFPGGITFGRIVFDEDPDGGFSTDGARSTIEVLDLMMGAGNDSLVIDGTLRQASEGDDGPARHGGAAVQATESARR